MIAISAGWSLVFLGILSLVLNIPLGAWRARLPRFSVRWFIAIHLSIPVIYWLRVYSGIDFQAIPVLIATAIAGQLLGGKIFSLGIRNKK